MSFVLILAGDTVGVRSMMMSLEVEGFEIKRVSNSDELISRFTSQQKVGVVIDLSAPWNALFPLLRRLRGHGTGRSYRITLFGTLPVEATDAALQSLGIREDDVFPEPVDLPRLVKRLRDLPLAVSQSREETEIPRSSLGFPIQGELDNGGLASIMSAIVSGKGTGQLEVETKGGLATISFKGGQVTAVSFPSGTLALGPFLIRKGALTETDIQELTSKGPITLESLIARNILSPHEIPAIAGEQAEAVIKWAVGPGRVTYRWANSAQPRSGGFPMGLNIHRIIIDAFKSCAGSRLPQDLEALSFNLDASQHQIVMGLKLLPLELRVMKLLDVDRTLQAVVDTVAGGNPNRAREVIGFVCALYALFASKTKESQPEQAIDWVRKKEEFAQELKRMENADPFEILGVTLDTPSSDVRARFFALSMQFHPDRAFSADPDVRDLMQTIFRKVQEAYEIVTDPKQREDYLARKNVQEGGLDPRAAINAEIAFSQGELYLKNKNFSKARQFFEESVSLNAHAPEYKCHLAWATYMADTSRYADAVKLLNSVLKDHPNLDKGFLFLGSILKARRDVFQAEAAFKKALAANPENVEAKRELRLFEMRREKTGPSSLSGTKKGFFDRFRRS